MRQGSMCQVEPNGRETRSAVRFIDSDLDSLTWPTTTEQAMRRSGDTGEVGAS